MVRSGSVKKMESFMGRLMKDKANKVSDFNQFTQLNHRVSNSANKLNNTCKLTLKNNNRKLRDQVEEMFCSVKPISLYDNNNNKKYKENIDSTIFKQRQKQKLNQQKKLKININLNKTKKDYEIMTLNTLLR